jgi:hypothetical protein
MEGGGRKTEEDCPDPSGRFRHGSRRLGPTKLAIANIEALAPG